MRARGGGGGEREGVAAHTSGASGGRGGSLTIVGMRTASYAMPGLEANRRHVDM